MTAFSLTALVSGIALTYIIAMLLYARSRGVDVLPAALFCAIEIAAVWPPLLTAQREIGASPALLATVGSMIFVLAYCVFSTPADGEQVTSPQVPEHTTRVAVKVGLTLLVTLLSALGLYIFRGVPPLVFAFQTLLRPDANAQSAELLRETRQSLTKGGLLGTGSAGQGALNLLETNGWQVAVVIAVLYWTWTRTRYAFCGAIGVIALAFIFLGSLGSRLPILLTVVAVSILLLYRFKLRIWSVVGLAVPALAIALLISPLSKGNAADDSLSGRFETLSTRVFSGNGQNNVAIVRLVESDQLTVRPGSLFVERAEAMVPGLSTTTPFAYRLTTLAYRTDTTAYSTPTQFGLIYADLGPLGVPLGYLLSGVFMALAWDRIMRLRYALAVACRAIFASYLGYMAITGFHGVLATVGVAYIMLFVCYLPALLQNHKRSPSKTGHLLTRRPTGRSVA